MSNSIFFSPLLSKEEDFIIRKKKKTRAQDFFYYFQYNMECNFEVKNTTLYLLLIYIRHTGHDVHFNIDIIYLLLLLSMVLLLLSVPPATRRLNIICPRRVSKGGFVDEDIVGVVMISSRAAELRRRF